MSEWNDAIEAAARVADPALPSRKGNTGIWRERRAKIAEGIRALKRPEPSLDELLAATAATTIMGSTAFGTWGAETAASATALLEVNSGVLEVEPKGVPPAPPDCLTVLGFEDGELVTPETIRDKFNARADECRPAEGGMNQAMTDLIAARDAAVRLIGAGE